MKFICQHDPHDPDHLVCKAKLSLHDAILVIACLILVAGTIFVVSERINISHKLLGNIIENKDESQQYSGQSEISLESEALYFSKEGEQIGRGPWPLKAGETTKVKVFLKIVGNSGYSPVVAGRLGEGIDWTGFVPIGQGISYEVGTKTVKWIARDQSEAIFEVAVTPTAAQLQEENLLIMDNIRLLVRDKEGNLIKNLLTKNIVLISK